MIRLADELAAAIPITKRDLENWVSRLDLATEYEPGKRGYRRKLTKWNALEPAMIGSLVRCGVQPSVAASVARSFVGHARSGWSKASSNFGRRYMVFNARDLARSTYSDSLDAGIRALKAADAIAFSVIDLQGLREIVDQLYSAPKPPKGSK